MTVNFTYAEHSESHQHQCQQSDKDSEDINKVSKICYQCQRTDYFMYNCYIKTDKSSEELLFNKDLKFMMKFEAVKVTENLKKLKNSENSKELSNQNHSLSREERAWKAVTMKALISLKLLSESWIIDFRVIHHMTSDQSFFFELHDYSTEVSLINEQSIRVTEIDRAEVFIKEERLTLSEILYVLRLNRNLLSIEAVSNHSIAVKFWDEKAVFKHNKSIIAIIRWHSLIYILQSTNRKITFKVQIYQKSVNDLTASMTAERALSMLKLTLKSVRAVLKQERASLNNSVKNEVFISITSEYSENSDFSTQTQTEYQKWPWRFKHADIY